MAVSGHIHQFGQMPASFGRGHLLNLIRQRQRVFTHAPSVRDVHDACEPWRSTGWAETPTGDPSAYAICCLASRMMNVVESAGESADWASAANAVWVASNSAARLATIAWPP